jgi:hypothetical protein
LQILPLSLILDFTNVNGLTREHTYKERVNLKKVFNLKTLLVVNAVFALIGGLGEALAPREFVGSFVASLDASGAFIAQNMGVFQLGTAVISFMAMNVQDRAALKAILAGFVVIHAGITLVALNGMASGVMSSEGVADLVIHGLLAVGFGYFLFVKNKAVK